MGNVKYVSLDAALNQKQDVFFEMLHKVLSEEMRKMSKEAIIDSFFRISQHELQTLIDDKAA